MELKLVDTPVNPKHYTGTACVKCGDTTRYVKSRACVSCAISGRKRLYLKDVDSEREKMRQSYARNSEVRKFRSEEWRLRRAYGMTMQDRDSMSMQQSGKCAICGNAPQRLHIDHCHTSGRVRGLLCGSCNRAVGLLKDCPDNFLRAIAYLNRTQKATNAA